MLAPAPDDVVREEMRNPSGQRWRTNCLVVTLLGGSRCVRRVFQGIDVSVHSEETVPQAVGEGGGRRSLQVLHTHDMIGCTRVEIRVSTPRCSGLARGSDYKLISFYPHADTVTTWNE